MNIRYTLRKITLRILIGLKVYKPKIRNTVRAVIIRGNAVLMLYKRDEAECERYALPGGGQCEGESLEQALQRECVEEIGTTVEIGPLLYVADYFKPMRAVPTTNRQRVEFLFRCSIPDDYVAKCGHSPDKHQIEVVWVDIRGLNRIPLEPSLFKKLLGAERSQVNPCYLGIVN